MLRLPHSTTALLLCFTALSSFAALGCGSRTGLKDDEFEGQGAPTPTDEVCDNMDQDFDGAVDEDFRDELGRYVAKDHCGRCGLACGVSRPFELEVDCGLVEEDPVCVATLCEEGYAPSSAGRCVPIFERLCLLCTDDGDCGDLDIARCASVGGEQRCVVGCEFGCPEGYVCDEGLEDEAPACVPAGGSCSCDPGDNFTVACAVPLEGETPPPTEEEPEPEPEIYWCPGSAMCVDGSLSMCEFYEDICDGEDNDCDGEFDEDFRDSRGAYSVDIRNCGECGRDCTAESIPEGDLVCGGDPFAPTCVLECPDTIDGIQPGDRVDADRQIATGCECTVQSPEDIPGPVGAEGPDLDVNCDGADGIVVESFYVAPDGDDLWPGSPTRPLRNIQTALMRASMSRGTDAPRPHVFIAAGSYTEAINVPDGVFVHGGYRRDFLSLQPDGFRTDIRAPNDSGVLGGAALRVDGAGATLTVVEWVHLFGADASEPSAPAVGAYLLNPGSQLVLRTLSVRSGVAGAGAAGNDGTPGDPPAMDGAAGDPPRASIENDRNECASGPENTVNGGGGAAHRCSGTVVSGGNGGASDCPEFAERQRGGQNGQPDSPNGGNGGQDSQGPIFGPSASCPRDVCCGLADFSVPSMFTGPQPGASGRQGRDGGAGNGCGDALGRFDAEAWLASTASAGTTASPGSGGSGGGAGGGTVIDFSVGCEWPDGLGGGGGGGGAGGCGGSGGSQGTSGGPSVAILIRFTGPSSTPTFTDLTIQSGDGGRGGDGGAGGEGAVGSLGGQGGFIPRSARSTPTLAGPFPGGRGGTGGSGGSGGGGGGGCGGGSIGIWVTGFGSPEPPGAVEWRADNQFVSGRGGVAGRGGGGPAPGDAGEEGGEHDVLSR